MTERPNNSPSNNYSQGETMNQVDVSKINKLVESWTKRLTVEDCKKLPKKALAYINENYSTSLPYEIRKEWIENYSASIEKATTTADRLKKAAINARKKPETAQNDIDGLPEDYMRKREKLSKYAR